MTLLWGFPPGLREIHMQPERNASTDPRVVDENIQRLDSVCHLNDAAREVCMDIVRDAIKGARHSNATTVQISDEITMSDRWRRLETQVLYLKLARGIISGVAIMYILRSSGGLHSEESAGGSSDNAVERVEAYADRWVGLVLTCPDKLDAQGKPVTNGNTVDRVNVLCRYARESIDAERGSLFDSSDRVTSIAEMATALCQELCIPAYVVNAKKRNYEGGVILFSRTVAGGILAAYGGFASIDSRREARWGALAGVLGTMSLDEALSYRRIVTACCSVWGSPLDSLIELGEAVRSEVRTRQVSKAYVRSSYLDECILQTSQSLRALDDSFRKSDSKKIPVDPPYDTRVMAMFVPVIISATLARERLLRTDGVAR